MDFIIEIFLEIFLEAFCEGYVYLFSHLIPDSRQKLKKIFVIIVCVLLFALFIAIILLVETNGKSIWGWLIVTVNVAYIVVGIVLNIIAKLKK